MITLIKYGLTKNLGDYNSERIDAEYQLSEGESAVEAMEKLKKFVKEGTIEEPKIAVEEPAKVEEPKVEEKPKKKATKKAPAKNKEVEEKPVEEKPKKAKALPKYEAYNRDLSDHKKAMGVLLDEVCPEWRNNEDLKAKAGGLSRDLNGHDFRDKKGKVVDDFKAAVIKEMVDM